MSTLRRRGMLSLIVFVWGLASSAPLSANLKDTAASSLGIVDGALDEWAAESFAEVISKLTLIESRPEYIKYSAYISAVIKVLCGGTIVKNAQDVIFNTDRVRGLLSGANNAHAVWTLPEVLKRAKYSEQIAYFNEHMSSEEREFIRKERDKGFALLFGTLALGLIRANRDLGGSGMRKNIARFAETALACYHRHHIDKFYRMIREKALIKYDEDFGTNLSEGIEHDGLALGQLPADPEEEETVFVGSDDYAEATGTDTDTDTDTDIDTQEDAQENTGTTEDTETTETTESTENTESTEVTEDAEQEATETTESADSADSTESTESEETGDTVPEMTPEEWAALVAEQVKELEVAFAEKIAETESDIAGKVATMKEATEQKINQLYGSLEEQKEIIKAEGQKEVEALTVKMDDDIEAIETAKLAEIEQLKLKTQDDIALVASAVEVKIAEAGQQLEDNIAAVNEEVAQNEADMNALLESTLAQLRVDLADKIAEIMKQEKPETQG